MPFWTSKIDISDLTSSLSNFAELFYTIFTLQWILCICRSVGSVCRRQWDVVRRVPAALRPLPDGRPHHVHLQLHPGTLLPDPPNSIHHRTHSRTHLVSTHTCSHRVSTRMHSSDNTHAWAQLLTGSFTKPWHHGFVAGYFFQPITVHDTEVLRNLIG